MGNFYSYMVRAVAALIASIIVMQPTVSQAQPGWVGGKIINIWADPSDVVLRLDQNGPCNTNMFNIRRTNVNFSELVSLMYTAGTAGTHVGLFVSGCDGDRNIVAQGSMDIKFP